MNTRIPIARLPVSKLSTAAVLPLAAMLLGGAGAAQAVTIVTGSGNNLQTAINAAASGDILIVRDGPYSSMTIDGKDLTVVEDTGHSVEIAAPCIVRNVANGLTVAIRGFTKIVDNVGTGHLIEDNAGHVWFEDCKLTTMGGQPPSFPVPPQSVLVSECNAVVFARCQISSDQLFATNVAGLVVFDSSVAAYECTIKGGAGAPNGNHGGDGMVVDASYAHLSTCAIQGGNGGNGATLFNPITGITTCTNGGPGGDGIVLTGGSLVEYIATTFTAGNGGSGGTGCSAGAPGSATVVVSGTLTQLPCAARLLTVAPSPAIGGTTQVTATAFGLPGELAFANYHNAPTFSAHPTECGVLLVDIHFYTSLGVIAANGQVTFQFTPPAATPGFGTDVYMQLGTYNPSTGAVRIGGNSVLTIH